MPTKINCAIYTRKSTDENLDKEFNTLDSQREACEAYITSQKSEGWVTLPEKYDDGGFSGGSLERPALEKLLEDVKAGRVNVIVVYKIDRLTRSLTDFSKLVEIFDQYGVTFVSVTQSFNTTTSMGRLTLNVLLSFAQFEREVTGERIRDKIAASKAKGMWMGGSPPFGFDIEDRRLVTNPEDAAKAKLIFESYLQLGCVRSLKMELQRRGIKSRERISVKKGHPYGGHYFSRGALYQLLKNPAYIGKIKHKDKLYDGLHKGIIPLELWEKVQTKLQNQSAQPRGVKKEGHTNLLAGLLTDEVGNIYTPVFTTKNNRKYRYYSNVKSGLDKNHPNQKTSRLPAHEIEKVVETALRNSFSRIIINTDDLQYVLENQHKIVSYELIQTCAEKVTVYQKELHIKILPLKLETLLKQHLQIDVDINSDVCNLTVPYQTKRVRDGAMIIKSPQRDVFDLPPEELKHLVQGVVWRDEHFAGAYINDIAQRENLSARCVRNRIMNSFTLLS